MVSNLKSETARANGAKSRGPTTAEGKEKSSRNAIKHGLTAGAGNILLDCEDPSELEATLNKLVGIHAPATPAETDIVEEMAAARWRIRRMWTIETGLLNTEIITQAATAATPDPNIHLASAFRALSDDSRSLALASRYEARLQRLYDRAYKTLRELQQERKSQPPEQPHTVKVMWVDSQEELDMRAAAAAKPEPGPEQHPPTESATNPELRNEPTDEPKTGSAEPASDAQPTNQHPTSKIQHPPSQHPPSTNPPSLN
jgi:hypothetical protein